MEGKRTSSNKSICEFISSASYGTGNRVFERFKDIKDRYQIPDGQIELELTESMVIEVKQLEKVKKIIAEIQACGFLCSLDDLALDIPHWHF